MMKAGELFRRAATSLWMRPLLAALVSLAAVVWRLRLFRFDLHVPIVYWGDALYQSVLAKALTEGTWNYYIDRLGAPFGMAAVDYPIGCTLDFALMKLLSFALHDGGLLINVYWLLSLCLAAAFASLFLTSLRASAPASICFGALYAIIPFGFYRNISHLDLVHFIVPAAAYLATSLWRELPAMTGSDETVAAVPSSRRSWWLKIGICVAIGLAFAYWAFFSCIVVAACSIIAFFYQRKVKVFALALLYIAVISTSALVSMTGSFLYWRQHGPNTSMHFKFAAEADIYGLTVRQMLTPIVEHPLPALAAVRQKIISAKFPNDSTESAMASLGSIGSAGFLLLALIAVGRPSRGVLSDGRLIALAGLSVGLVLIAEVGGFGSIFNALILREFRCYNRISPFISLFSFAAISIVADQLLRRKLPAVRSGLFGSLVVIGMFDQIPVAIFRHHSVEENNFYADRKFIHELEARLPKNAMVFQLPDMGFSLDAGQNKIRVNDNARPYLHSRTLRWSWGNMEGRHHDWAKTVADLPMPQFLQSITKAGFEGLLIDRYGYLDAKVETEAAAALGSPSLVDDGGRWVFFDLRSLSGKQASLSSAENLKRGNTAEAHIGIDWLPKFSVEEHASNHTWHWCGQRGLIRFTNDSPARREIEIAALLQQSSPGTYPVSIERPGLKIELDLGADPVPYHDRIVLEAHTVVELEFRFSGPLLAVPGDPRELAFRVNDFRIKEIAE